MSCQNKVKNPNSACEVAGGVQVTANTTPFANVRTGNLGLDVNIAVSNPGGGYGKYESVTKAVDECAEWLLRNFPDKNLKRLDKRCNSHGLSGGAARDLEGTKYLETAYILKARVDEITGKIVYGAGFSFHKENVDRVKSEVPNGLIFNFPDREYATIYSPSYETVDEAGNWLKEWAKKYCPHLG